jgi:hypothetical protein
MKKIWVAGLLCLVLAVTAYAGVTNISGPKHPFEALRGSVDFSTHLPVGDNVASCTLTGWDQATGVSWDNVFSDNAISGQTVIYTYKGGVDGSTYKIKFQCTSDNGYKVQQNVIFTVKED